MFDVFLNIDGIPGESTDSAHQNWIEVLHFDLGCEQMSSGSASTAGARTSGRVQHAPFRFRHNIDKASPKLFLSCCRGDHIKKMQLQVCRATGDKQVYYTVDLGDSVVSRVNLLGDGQNGADVPLEEVEISYGNINWTYTETDHQTGKPKGNVTAQWSLTENKGQ